MEGRAANSILQNHWKTHHFQQIYCLSHGSWKSIHRKLSMVKKKLNWQLRRLLLFLQSISTACFSFPNLMMLLLFVIEIRLLQSLHRCCKLLIWWCLAVYLVLLSVCYLLFILSSLLAMYSSIYSFLKESKAIVCRSSFKPYSPSAPEHPSNIGTYGRFQYI